MGTGKTLTFIAGLRHDGIVAPCVLDGPINGESFTAWVEQILIPELEPGSIVVLDITPVGLRPPCMTPHIGNSKKHPADDPLIRCQSLCRQTEPSLSGSSQPSAWLRAVAALTLATKPA